MPTLSQFLANKLIPWSDTAASRIVVGSAQMKPSALPEGVRLEKRPLRGKRTIIKRNRLYRNSRIITASWPEQGLNETNCLKMACVLSGYVDFQLGGQAVLCGPGYFIFIPPNLPHPDGTRNISDLTKSTSCEVLYFRLNHNALQCWISRYEPNLSEPQMQGNYLLTHEHVTHLFSVCMEEAIASTPGQRELSEKLLQSFLRVIQREIQAGRLQEVPHGEGGESRQRHFGDTENFSEYLHQYIQSHLYNRPTLENAARYMYLSRAQFARRVRAETGKTFVEILNEHRIKTARELLRDSDWTVSSIATFLGYRSPNFFQSLFRQHTGMTPNEYRQQARKK
jgi:AraC-like DNA-binding protein